RKRALYEVGNLKQKSDRLALCEYMLTGQLSQLLGGGGSGAGGGGELVGSVVMFGAPKGGPERALDESFLEALPWKELAALRLRAGGGRTAGPIQDGQPDLVSAGVALLRR
ncbi:hypothetical protein Agub_g11116, partial [Astrephomene gubernaculifera]